MTAAPDVATHVYGASHDDRISKVYHTGSSSAFSLPAAPTRAVYRVYALHREG